MKKVEDELRPRYKRSDFSAPLERGKFYKEAVKGISVVLLDRDVAKAFPTSEAVNGALRGLLDLAEQAHRRAARSKAGGSRRRAA